MALLSEYAAEPIGGGRELAADARRELVPGLRRHPAAFVLLAHAGADAVGVAVCFVGYSTFAARPLVNVHDLAVTAAWRRRGVARVLLEAVAARARELGCCKVTLEVREDNAPAQALYRSLGFDGGEPRALFWQMSL
ncbi:MAG: GNAT family N-acetyltransferase [Candidatus Binatia bacterium]